MAQSTKQKKEEKWQIVQEKAFTGWMAQTLSARQMTVTDLRTDLEDGIALINFFELLTRSTLKDKYDRSPKSRIQKIQNCHLALKFLERETGINTSQAGYCAEDIVDAKKDLRMILGLLWTLYRKYRMVVQVAGPVKTSKVGPEELLLEWVKTVLGDKYPDIHISNYKNSFSNGLVFAALAHEYDAEALGRTWADLKTMQPAELNELIMSHAEKKMGISRLLDVDEIVEGTVDDRALALYTSLFHTAFEAKKHMDEMQLNLGEARNKVELEQKSREELVKMNYDLTATLAQTNVQMKEDQERYEKVHEDLVGLRERFLDLQRVLDLRDKEINTLKLSLGNAERERNDLIAKTRQIEERNDQLTHQVEAIQELCDSETSKAKKASTELKTTKEELAEVSRRLKAETEAKEGDERKLSQQLEEEAEKTRKLTQDKTALEGQVEQFESQITELQTTLTEQTKQKKKTDSQLKEHKDLFKTSTMGLAVLRRNLDQHLDDIHRWKKYLEGTSTDVDEIDNAIDQLSDEMAKMSFTDQLNLISNKLDGENVEMTKILQERMGRSASSKLKKEKKEDEDDEKKDGEHHHKEKDKEKSGHRHHRSGTGQ